MRRGATSVIHYATATVVVLYLCTVGVVSAARQAAPEPSPEMSENVFKDIQVLKGIPVDEFLDSMGMFANALGYDCVSCHSPEIANLSTFDAFAIPTPKIQRARQMVVMMNTINRTYFGGEQRVTCFTCHTSDNKPDVAASLDLQYGPLVDDPYEIEFFPAFFAPSPDEIFAAYAEALGGTDRLAALTSYVASGTYAGYDTGQEDVPMEILAKAPNKRSIVAQGPQGLSVWKTDGVGAWKMQPSTPLPVVPMTGGNLVGARVDAMMSFPSGIQQAYTEWQVGYADLDGRQVNVAYGTKEGETPIALYFEESGLLSRLIRWNITAVGPVPTQLDFTDYREVAGVGVQMPFGWKITWTGGEVRIALTDVQPNVEIDDASFARPVPVQ
jgi:hypothetical protein